jgi:hypothetical protein
MFYLDNRDKSTYIRGTLKIPSVGQQSWNERSSAVACHSSKAAYGSKESPFCQCDFKRIAANLIR